MTTWPLTDSVTATLADLESYASVPKDAAVVAWPVSHTRPDIANSKRDIEFTVKAQVLKLKEDATEAEAEKPKEADQKEVKDEL